MLARASLFHAGRQGEIGGGFLARYSRWVLKRGHEARMFDLIKREMDSGTFDFLFGSLRAIGGFSESIEREF